MFRPRWVLVVEDDEAMRALLVEELERDGFDVEAVGALADARRLLVEARTDPRRTLPSLMVTDRRVPDGDGLDLIRVLRAYAWWVPVVVLTAFADDETHRRARAAGACRVLSKPVTLDVVSATARGMM